MFWNRDKILLYISLATWMLAVLFVMDLRLFNLASSGIVMGDSHEYVGVALKWLQGDFHANRLGFFRPAGHLFHWLAYKLFDVHEYTLRYASAFADLCTIVVMSWLTYVISRRYSLLILSVIVYGLQKYVIIFARSETIHTPTALFVTLAVFFVYISIVNRKLSNISPFISGFIISIGFLMHPSCVFMLALWPIFYVISTVSVNDYNYFTLKSLLPFISYIIGVFVPFMIALSFYGYQEIFYLLSTDQSAQINYVSHYGSKWQILSYFASPIKALYDYIDKAHGAWAFYFLVLSISGFTYREIRGAKRFHLFIPGAATILYCCVFWGIGGYEESYSRILLHIAPMISICLLIYPALFIQALFLKNSPRYVSIVLLTVYVLAITYPSRGIFKERLYAYGVFGENVYSAVYNKVSDKLEHNDKVLIMPFLFYSNDKGFQSPFYFGKKAIYIREYKCVEDSFNEFIKENHVKYIFWAETRYDRRLLMENTDAIREDDFFCLNAKGEYTVAKEKKELLKYIDSLGARAKKINSSFGPIYQVD